MLYLGQVGRHSLRAWGVHSYHSRAEVGGSKHSAGSIIGMHDVNGKAWILLICFWSRLRTI